MVKFSRNDKIETAIIGEELGMLDVEKGSYYMLDSIGNDIWEFLIQPRTYDEIVNTLLKLYDVTEEECKQDIDELLNNLVHKNILREE